MTRGFRPFRDYGSKRFRDAAAIGAFLFAENACIDQRIGDDVLVNLDRQNDQALRFARAPALLPFNSRPSPALGGCRRLRIGSPDHRFTSAQLGEAGCLSPA